MPNNVVGTIPEFTTDETVAPEVKPATEQVAQETDTPSGSSPEPKPDDQQVVDDNEQVVENVPQTPQLETVVVGLQQEAMRLRKEIDTLKDTRRQIRSTEPLVQERQEPKADMLADIAQTDVDVVEKILRAKGYITK